MAKNVNSEGSNTDKMQAHQLSKCRVGGDAMRHEESDLMMSTDLIDQSRSIALNGCSDSASLVDVLTANPDDKALVSDVDPQLILKVFFKEKVNLSAVCLRFSSPPVQEGDDETYSKPRLIKIYNNNENLDFGDLDSCPPASQTVLENEEETEIKISCVGHKFQRVQSLQILIEEALDSEATRTFLNRVSILGHQSESYHATYK